MIPNFVWFSERRLQKGNETKQTPAVYRGSGKRNGKRPRIVHVSNFRPVKNIDGLARIFLGIRERIRAELWLVGDGQEIDKIARFFKWSRFMADIRYWGFRSDVTPILQKADLFLMTSFTESFGLSALEAMACGVPVLATDVGGLPEVVRNGKTGFLFPVDNPEAAVDLGVRLLNNQALYREMVRRL